MNSIDKYKKKHFQARKKREEEKQKIKAIAYGIENNILQSNLKMARRIYRTEETNTLIKYMNFASVTSQASGCISYNQCNCPGQTYCLGVCYSSGACAGACSSTPEEQCCGNDDVLAGETCMNGIYYGFLTISQGGTNTFTTNGYVALQFVNCINTNADDYNNSQAANTVMTAFFGNNVSGATTTLPPNPGGTPAAIQTNCDVYGYCNPLEGNFNMCCKQYTTGFPYGYTISNALIVPTNGTGETAGYINCLYTQTSDSQSYPNFLTVLNNSPSDLYFIDWAY